AAGASQFRWVPLFTLVASSTIGLFYYLRIIVAMYSQPEGPGLEAESSTRPLPLPATLALAALTGLIFLLGVYPAPLWAAIIAVTRDLGRSTERSGDLRESLASKRACPRCSARAVLLHGPV